MGKKQKLEGERIEERFIKMFKGKKTSWPEVDFETSRCLYEVKSCNLFNKTTNSNHIRDHKDKIHKRCEGVQLGRFTIITDNHIMLYLRALQQNKIPKYIFVLKYGGQVIFKIKLWDEVILFNEKKYKHIPLNQIF